MGGEGGYKRKSEEGGRGRSGQCRERERKSGWVGLGVRGGGVGKLERRENQLERVRRVSWRENQLEG